ncbi:hypothetical protein [Desulfosporosinus sp. OT]|uniref:hypothetical protein n=1 Tax=Desulfosporosinus sp. OT TaxID=913865 RepID=UPI000223A414|nr:hypothetical protein [Desulfosporosinus sp. OT]EGW39940.1 putative membrane protein [Desulfosporosinus sp. OT]
MDQSKGQLPPYPYPYPPYFGTYPLSPSFIQGYKPPVPNANNCASLQVQIFPSNQDVDLKYWISLSPALLGAAGAFFLSLFSGNNHSIERFEGTLFKLTLVGYAIGATVSVSFYISHIITNSKTPHDHLLYPVVGALVSIILLFAADYLLLYRFFPSSFKGDVGDDLCNQLFSFLYLSTTTIATAGLGDILPANVTARALIATEISFYLFTMATGIQLLLVQH